MGIVIMKKLRTIASPLHLIHFSSHFTRGKSIRERKIPKSNGERINWVLTRINTSAIKKTKRYARFLADRDFIP
jgi:hypothetical protein